MRLVATTCMRPLAAAGRRVRPFIAALLAASALMAQAACVVHATYPPVAGGNPLTPGLPPVPEVMAKALVYAHARTGEGEELVFNLPPGISPGVWAGVRQSINTAIESLGAAAARPMEPGDARVWSISQIRIRGFAAEVDVVYLDREVYQMATVHLATEPMRSYQAEFLQRWLIPVEAPVPHWPLLPAATPEAASTELPADEGTPTDPQTDAETDAETDAAAESATEVETSTPEADSPPPSPADEPSPAAETPAAAPASEPVEPAAPADP
jgi:hypothetical protein